MEKGNHIRYEIQVALIIVLAVMCNVIGLADQVFYATTPYLINDDTRALFHYYRYEDSSLFADDYIANYLAKGFTDFVGYDWLMKTATSYFGLNTTLDVLPLCLVAFSAMALSFVLLKLGGRMALFMGLISFFSYSTFFERINSSIPHSFAYPIMLIAIAALVYGNMGWLIVALILAGLFYSPMTPIIGLMLAIYVLVLPKKFQSEKVQQLNVYVRCLILLVCAAVTMYLIWPTLPFGEDSDFGRRLSLQNDLAQFPELDPNGGRNPSSVSSPVVSALQRIVGNFIYPAKMLILPLLSFLIITYFFFNSRLSSAGSRFAIFIISVIICAVLGHYFMPAFVYRALLYTLPLIALILLPVGLCDITHRLCKTSKIATGILAVLTLVLSFSFAEKTFRGTGYTIQIDKSYAPILQTIEDLPKNALIAGFPGSSQGVIENVPFFAKHKAFVLYEAQVPSHEGFTLEMRQRMNALIDAYFATDIKDVLALRDKWGVDYLIVNTVFYDYRPSYFKPFNDKIEKIWKENKAKSFILPTLFDTALEGSNDTIKIIDLRQME